MKGIWKKVLKVDLSKGTCTAEPVPERVYEYFPRRGGIGSLLHVEGKPEGNHAFDPANCLTFRRGDD